MVTEKQMVDIRMGQMTKAVAYFRTSSATNVGDDKDSEKRQRDAVTSYAEKCGIEVVKEFYDAAVRGGDSVGDRPGFTGMLSYMMGNGARVVLVENAGRFARDLVVQLTGHDFLKKSGITLIPVDSPDYFTNDTPTAVMVRQILGAVSQFEKTSLVEKMRKARERKRMDGGRCEGRKPAVDEAIEMAKRLRGEGMTLRRIGAELSTAGYRVRKKNKEGVLVTTDSIYKPQSIKVMLKS